MQMVKNTSYGWLGAMLALMGVGSGFFHAVGAAEPPDNSAPSVVFLLDASSKMWDEKQGEPIINQVRQALRDALSKSDINVDMRIAAYGRDRYHPCYDMDFLTPFADRSNREAVLSAMSDITLKKKQPIELALERAIFAAEEGHAEGRNSVVLISGGAEVCGSDPCALAERLARSNPRLHLEVIGYNVPPKGYPLAELQCIAKRGRGTYRAVSSRAELDKALADVMEKMAQPLPVAAPEPAYRDVLRDEFESTQLADHWQILNPYPAAYSIGDGVLRLKADNQSGEKGPSVKNIFQLAMPAIGDWRISAKVDMQPQTTHEELSVGITDGHNRYIAASIVPVGYAPTTLSLAVIETTPKGERYVGSTMYRDVLKGWMGIERFAKEKMPFTLQLIKNGNQYRARAESVVDKRFVFETEPLTLPEVRGKFYLNLHQRTMDVYHQEQDEEHTTSTIDWVLVEQKQGSQ